MDFLNLFNTVEFSNPFGALAFFFLKGGWVVVLIVFLRGMWEVRLVYVQERYRQSVPYVLLALDMPKEHEQNMKAAENIFSQMAAIQSSGNRWERLWLGKNQETYSLEILAKEGRVQMMIRTPKPFQPLVESAVYSQYPDARITEVEDYTHDAPKTFPDEEYNMWGTEFQLVKDEAYPIRTYMNFEYALGQKFADPMSSVVETLSRFQKSEQVWLQWILIPVDPSWQVKAQTVVKKLIGEKIKATPSLVEKVTLPVINEALFAINQVLGDIANPLLPTQAADTGPKNLVQFMTEAEKRNILMIQEKLSKIGFKVKFRYLYLAKHEDFNKAKGVAAVIGSLMQFNTLHMNAFKPGKRTKTGVDHFFVKQRVAARQRALINAYRRRDKIAGEGGGFILNIEELATLFHFPTLLDVRSLALSRTEAKMGEAPASLPIEQEAAEEASLPSAPASNVPLSEEVAFMPKAAYDVGTASSSPRTSDSAAGLPPANLPFV